MRTPSGCARHAHALALTLVALIGSACASGVKYPRCAADRDCAQAHEVCVAGHCQACRDDAGCEAQYPGEGRACHEGRCEAAACQGDGDCHARGPGFVCRDGACVAGCAGHGDCGPGMACVKGHCRPGCAADGDCRAGEICAEGTCRAGEQSGAGGALSATCQPDGNTPGQVVRLDAVRFAFNTFDLSDEAQARLQEVANCLREAPQGLQVIVDGHCDDRGTQEYNLALGQRRAQAVVDYLVRLGAEGRRLNARTKGENEPLCQTADEACFAENRRVEFVQSLGGAP